MCQFTQTKSTDSWVELPELVLKLTGGNSAELEAVLNYVRIRQRERMHSFGPWRSIQHWAPRRGRNMT